VPRDQFGGPARQFDFSRGPFDLNTIDGQEAQPFPCDVCGSEAATEIPCVRQYNGDQAIHVCDNCGFVFVRLRRSAGAIADTWSHEMYQVDYLPRIPAVRARHRFVADFIDDAVGLRGKRVLDIGAGDGGFLELIQGTEYGAKGFGIEPSADNCANMTKLEIGNFQGTMEEYETAQSGNGDRFDVATIVWTLENCRSCRRMISACHEMLSRDGSIAIATGSRILVPFKKPLQYYFGTEPADAHPFRFSANTIRGVLAVSGFEVTHINRYIDGEYLVVVAHKRPLGSEIPWRHDNPNAVLSFFERWHRETQDYYRDV
jgi:SAM-dependent methyltransferase